MTTSPPCPLGLAEQLAEGMFVPISPTPITFDTNHDGHPSYRIEYGECTEIVPPLLPDDHNLSGPPLRIAYDCWESRYEVFRGGRRVKTFPSAGVDAIPELRPFLRATYESCAAAISPAAAPAEDINIFVVAFGGIPPPRMQTAEHPDPSTFRAKSFCGAANTATRAMELAERAAQRPTLDGCGIGIFLAKDSFFVDDLRGLVPLRWAPFDDPESLLKWVECLAP